MKDPKIAKFILEQELPPDSPTPNPTPQTSDSKQTKPTESTVDRIKVLDHVRQINLEACSDPYLEEYLPHLLDTQLCRTVDNRWIIANPVHAVHLASQMDESQQQPQQNLQQQLQSWKQNPLLFGDEEQRTTVLKSMGISENWCPMDGTSAGVEEDRIVEPVTLSPRFNGILAPVGSMMPPFAPSATMPIQPVSARSAMTGMPPSSGVMPMDVDSNQVATKKPPATPQQIVSSSNKDLPNSSSTAVAKLAGSEPASSANQINPKAIGGKNLSAIKSAVGPPSSDASATAATSSGDVPPAPTSGVAPGQTPESSKGKVETAVPGTTADSERKGTKTSVTSAGSSAIPDKTASTQKEGTPATNGGQDDKTNASQNARQGKGKGGKGLLLAKHGGGNNPNQSSAKHGATPLQPSVTPKALVSAPGNGTSVAPGPHASTDANGGSAKPGSGDQPVPPTTTSAPQGTGGPPKDGQIPKTNSIGTPAANPANAVQSPPLDPKATTRMMVDPSVSTKPMMPTGVPSASPVGSSGTSQSLALEDEHYHQLRLAENSIQMVRRSIATYGRTTITNKKKSESAKKKRKKDHEFFRCAPVPGWVAPPPKELNTWQEGEWNRVRRTAPETVERWMENFRISRGSYWSERSLKKATTTRGMAGNQGNFYLPAQDQSFSNGNGDESGMSSNRKRSRVFMGDELMMCLECGFNGSAPKSIAAGSDNGMLEHLLVSGHKFAVTCGERAQVFSFGSGDFVYHNVFDQEKFRVDTMKQLPNLAWKEHKVQRSFDPFQFISTKDHGVVWRGPVATYPALVPRHHLRATELIHRRKSLFEGRVREKWLLTKPNAMAFSASQHLLDHAHRYQIDAPVGMYNLGNTCYMTAILQCLVHCTPLQQYFLRDSSHHYKASKVYRDTIAEADKMTSSAEKLTAEEKKDLELCLAYEMDRLFLSYYGSAIGQDVLSVIEESSHNLCFGESNADDTFFPTEIQEVEKGEPLIPSSLLATIWKSEHLKHLAGYKQHDAHEFLNSFLEQMSKNIKQYRDRVIESINTARDENCIMKIPKTEPDVVTRLFEGQLRSVLLCEECGTKRVQAEPFMNISLTLSEEVERLEKENNIGGDGAKLSVQTCLDHYVLPERLVDPVECPSCAKRTSTKTQHTFSKLPKILCLHLKRFDAARNKKIEEFVSFPARGLNMGPMLSHWSEVSSVLSAKNNSDTSAEPRILYDLFGTVNHLGNMQSGHYVSNVKVKDQWYHCNDQHVSRAGDGNDEEAVLNSEGAYILFYIRR